MEGLLAAFLLSFGVALLVAPLVIRAAKKLKAGQIILSYVDSHMSKSGTPTMGGIIFLIGAAAGCLITFRGDKQLGYFALAVGFAYGINGFLDDFIKVRFKQNKGLSALSKIIFQLAIAIIVAIFVRFNPQIGSSIYLPFSAKEVDLGVFIIPFSIFIFLALTNSVNLTDGLDGLAGGVSLVYLLCFSIVLLIVCERMSDYAEPTFLEANLNLVKLSGAFSGAIAAFLIFNSHPAKIFMGDTGALALGGVLASLASLTRLALVVPIMGIFFVFSSVSVIIQVAYFKKTKKRVFLMSPLHHHFEKKGYKETKIVSAYMIITAVVGSAVVLGYLLWFKP